MEEEAEAAKAADIHEVTASEMPAEELPVASGPEAPAAVKQDTDEMQLISEDMLTDSDSEAADPVSEEVFLAIPLKLR